MLSSACWAREPLRFLATLSGLAFVWGPQPMTERPTLAILRIRTKQRPTQDGTA